MTYRDERLKQEVRKLRQRVAYYKKQGYDINADRILERLTGNTQSDIEYLKSLRGERLKSESLVLYEFDDTDFDRYMNPYSENEADFVPPEDVYDPHVYTRIEQIRATLSQFPNTLVIQFDEGKLKPDYGGREEISVEAIGDALYDTFTNTIEKAEQEGRLRELEQYLQYNEEKLGNILEPYYQDLPYYWESELLNDFTKAMSILNWGEAFSSEELENIADIYEFTDVELNPWGDEFD